MTESEYKTVVKLMIEKLERYKDEIAEKDAEIDGLNKEVDRLSQIVLCHDGDVADAVKEFAERLHGKARAIRCGGVYVYGIALGDINETKNEMVGGNNDG